MTVTADCAEFAEVFTAECAEFAEVFTAESAEAAEVITAEHAETAEVFTAEHAECAEALATQLVIAGDKSARLAGRHARRGAAKRRRSGMRATDERRLNGSGVFRTWLACLTRRPAAQAAPRRASASKPRRRPRFPRALRSIIFPTTFVAAAALASPAQAQQIHLLVITGVSGDEQHAKLFHELATRFIDAAKKKDAVADANIMYLAEKPDVDPARIGGRSNKEGIEKAFADLAAKVKPDDEVYVLLFGHGSFDGKTGAFNIPGPDLTAADYAKLLGRLSSQRIVFVDTSSASGAFLPAVAGPGRIVVTATKTGGERLEPRFPEFFVEAYESDAADRDRNGRISVSEAFDYAKAQVAAAYQKAGTIQTEHAALDDGNEGKLAAMVFLSTGGRVPAGLDMNNPQVRELVKERDALEQQVAALRLRKASMDQAQYDQELEKLLVALAQKTKALQALEGKKQ